MLIWFAAQETFLIISNIENSWAASYIIYLVETIQIFFGERKLILLLSKYFYFK